MGKGVHPGYAKCRTVSCAVGVLVCSVSRVMARGVRKPFTSVVVWKVCPTVSGMSQCGVSPCSFDHSKKTCFGWPQSWAGPWYSIFQFSKNGIETQCSKLVSNFGDSERKSQVRTFQMCELGGLMSFCTCAQEPRDRSETSRVRRHLARVFFTWTL